MELPDLSETLLNVQVIPARLLRRVTAENPKLPYTLVFKAKAPDGRQLHIQPSGKPKHYLMCLMRPTK